MQVKGSWGQYYNLFWGEHDVELGIVEPRAPTQLYRMSHEDAVALRDVLTALIDRHAPVVLEPAAKPAAKPPADTSWVRSGKPGRS